MTLATYFAGIDIGSTMTKAVILDKGIVVSIIGPTGPEQRRLANKVMEEALNQAALSLNAMTYIVATGYGRINVPFADKQFTEITCHAKGIIRLFPKAKTIIDIGGQDVKGIKIDVAGKINDFVMNDKCAAGSGRFIEVIADTLGVSLDQVGDTISAKQESCKDQQHLYHMGPTRGGSQFGTRNTHFRSACRSPLFPC